MDAERKAEARELVDQSWWGNIGKILHARRCLKVALDELDASEARVKELAAESRDRAEALCDVVLERDRYRSALERHARECEACQIAIDEVADGR